MAKLPSRTELTTPASDDLIHVVDVSDTTSDPTGTSKKMTRSNFLNGTGDVVGPSGATNNAVPRYDTTTGKLLQDSNVIIDDDDNISGAANISGASATLSGLTASELVASDGSKNLQSLAVATYPSLTEVSYVKGTTSAIQTQIDGKQDQDNLLDDISTLSGNGIITRVNANTAASRSIVAGSSKISVTNGSGVSGNPSIDLDLTQTFDFSSGTLRAATPSADADAATKSYVDSLANGLAPRASVIAATTSALPAVTYDNGTSGVGATLTADANGAFPTLDGVSASLNNEYLVKDQSSGLENGFYTLTQVGDGSNPFILTRRDDFDSSDNIIDGATTWVEQGTSNTDKRYSLTTNSPITVGTTALSFSQTGGSDFITAGDGLTKTGNDLSVNVDDSTIEINTDTLRVKDAGITNAKVATGIDAAKLADGSVSNTELQYINTLSSNAQTQINAKAPIASPTFTGTVKGVSIPFTIAISDEIIDMTTGTAKVTWRAPYACNVDDVRASLSTASSSGTPTFDINEGGASILSTKITIDANEKTSTTAATPPVISDSSLADDAEITFDVDVAGTGARGAKITMYLTRT